MRVLLISDWAPTEGGVETYLAWLRHALREAGDDVRLLTAGAGSAAGGTADYVAFGTERRVLQAGLQVVNPLAAAAARRAVREFDPDVAHVSMFEMHLSPTVVFALGRVPTVLSIPYYKPVCPIGLKLLPSGELCSEPAGWVCVRSGCVSVPHWLRDRPRYALIGRALRRADRIVTCSAWMLDLLARNGVEAEHLVWPVTPPRPDFRRRPAPDPLFVYTGRLSREKGVELLLAAFARARSDRDWSLRLVGDGPLRGDLERLARRLGLAGAVTFAGHVPPDEVERELEAAWALVAPSLWAEPLGLSAVEAAVRGVPVIASAPGGFRETIEPGVAGLLFATGDEDELVEALRAVAERRAFPTLRVDPGAARRARERHAPGRHLEALRNVFADVAGGAALAS